MKPLRYVWQLLVWFLLRLMWFSTQLVNLPGLHGKGHDEDDLPDPPPPPEPYLHYYPCDQKKTLYMLNQTIAAKGITNHSDYCSRLFYVQKVAHTNLILVVVNSLHPTCYERLEVAPANISPDEYANRTGDKSCRKLPLHALKRQRQESCFTEHPLEHEINECGDASGPTISLSLLFITLIRILSII